MLHGMVGMMWYELDLRPTCASPAPDDVTFWKPSSVQWSIRGFLCRNDDVCECLAFPTKYWVLETTGVCTDECVSYLCVCVCVCVCVLSLARARRACVTRR